MSARRSRTARWRTCLEEIARRRGMIEIAQAPGYGLEVGTGDHLVWRVKVIGIEDRCLLVEAPQALGRIVPLAEGVDLVGVLVIGQNRWMFRTRIVGRATLPMQGVTVTALRLQMPGAVHRCHRRDHYRVEMAQLRLPAVDIWPLRTPISVGEIDTILAQMTRYTEAGSEMMDDRTIALPLLGPCFHGHLINIGGGGLGLNISREFAGCLSRCRLFWVRIDLPPVLEDPLHATVSLAHTRLLPDRSVSAGFAFDFGWNPAHREFVVDQICRYVAVQQRCSQVSISGKAG